MDIILERVEKGLCPINNAPLTKDFKRVHYKGQIVWIEDKYPCPENILVSKDSE